MFYLNELLQISIELFGQQIAAASVIAADWKKDDAYLPSWLFRAT